MEITITDYSQEHQSAIRRMLERIGWTEQYIIAAEQNAEIFVRDQKAYGVYSAVLRSTEVCEREECARNLR